MTKSDKILESKTRSDFRHLAFCFLDAKFESCPFYMTAKRRLEGKEIENMSTFQ